MMFRIILLIFSLVSPPAQAQGCHITPGWQAMSSGEIELEKAGHTFSLPIRIADNSSKRAAGYQWICEADTNNTAVLFEFSEMVTSAFHMRNVYIPLDIFFFDDSGKQIDAMVMRPEPPGQGIKPRYYQPVSAFLYALEIARPQTHDLKSTPTPMRLLIDSL